MADSRKYYYLKLKDDFFDREEIRIIEAQPNGYMYVNILLKLYLKSLKRKGKLMVTDRIPYSVETLSSIVGHNCDVVRNAIDVFKEFKLLEVLDTGAIYLTELQNFIGQSSTEADRKREYRKEIENEKQKLLTGQKSDKCPIIVKNTPKNEGLKNEKGQMSDNSPLDKDKDIDIDINLDIQQQIEKIVKCTPDEAIVIFNTVNKYHKDKDVVNVVVEKLNVICKGNFNNKIGALITAIKQNWVKATVDNSTVNGFNNFEGRSQTTEYYDNLEKKLLGWDSDNNESNN